MKIYLSKSSEAITIPVQGSPGSSGFDLQAYLPLKWEDLDLADRATPRVLGNPVCIEPGKWVTIPTGIRLQIPIGYEGQVRSRSGLAAKYGIAVLNSPGTIDSDYRGEIKVILINHGQTNFVVEHGMKIAQLVFAEIKHEIEFWEVPKLPSETSRGAGGFGSTGI